jgi:hypothetical protein
MAAHDRHSRIGPTLSPREEVETQSKKKRQIRTFNFRPSSMVRLPRLRERCDDPPAILKRDTSRICIAQVDDHSHRVRLSYPRCERAGVMSNLLRVDLVERVHLSSRDHVHGEQLQMFKHHSLLSLAHPKCQRRCYLYVRLLRRPEPPCFYGGSSSGYRDHY